ncbi:ABC transporter permease [Romboutsia sedimentorum]|uniref:ABC transporter permease n=1 Tax=Romboutsia sedimentorum TaxID=1368474 RepID=UPI0024DE576E|nr:ABC transporter permease [Romboutsia sedimentorum]MDK2584367.1 ABC transporter permease [Romboutsia sedimentorum]
MRINAIINRIIRQFFRDKRTLALLILAPILILTLMNYVFSEQDTKLDIGVQNENIQKTLSSLEKEENVFIITKEEADIKFKNQELDAYIKNDKNNINVIINGSDSSINMKAMNVIKGAISKKMPNQANAPKLNIDNYYGSNDMETIDYIGPVLIGLFIFFFVFLISGVSFLRERTTGTLERLLATPIKRYEIVLGYLIGFGIFTIFQSTIISAYSIWVLDIYNAGEIGLILLITVIIALCALSFGMFLSSYANNELQMIQFIPLVILPQVFLCGLFSVRTMVEPLQFISKFMPLTYASKSLNDVMICGASFMDILPSLGILLTFTVVFAILNILALKKHRIW